MDLKQIKKRYREEVIQSLLTCFTLEALEIADTELNRRDISGTIKDSV